LLQLTANIYDATTNRNPLQPQVVGANTLYAPTVFRPLFSKDTNNNIFITDFVEETGTNFLLAKIGFE